MRLINSDKYTDLANNLFSKISYNDIITITNSLFGDFLLPNSQMIIPLYSEA